MVSWQSWRRGSGWRAGEDEKRVEARTTELIAIFNLPE